MKAAGRPIVVAVLLTISSAVGTAPTAGTIGVQSVRAAAADGPGVVPDATQVRIGLLKNGAYVVTPMALETYVSRVVAGEAAAGSAPAALQAMAIAVRTFALANRGRHRADGFDLCDQTHCQVVRTATATTDSATRATAGQVLLHDGVPATVYYSASCGGRTERPSAVWPGAEDPAYLPSRADDACGGDPAWEAALTVAQLQGALASAGFRGTLRAVSIGSRSESGRVSRLRLDGVEPAEISGQDLRVAVGRTLGWQYLKSTAFDVRKDGTSYRFTGHGSGHGVGMCVIGATHLASAGQSAKTILGRYYPGLAIGPVGPRLVAAGPTIAAAPPPAPVAAPAPAVASAGRAGRVADIPKAGTVAIPDVFVSLPDEDEGERGAIVLLTAKARDELSKTLGIVSPMRVTLRFHPTTGNYERATGQPWFTAGAPVGNEAHFVPLASLRDRGVLERTIRRELVHLMTDATLAGRPAWVREGAALFFADAVEGGGVIAAPSRGPRIVCPLDAELLHPASAGGLAEAFGRARSCFARQIADGRAWRDVK